MLHTTHHAYPQHTYSTPRLAWGAPVPLRLPPPLPLPVAASESPWGIARGYEPAAAPSSVSSCSWRRSRGPGARQEKPRGPRPRRWLRGRRSPAPGAGGCLVGPLGCARSWSSRGARGCPSGWRPPRLSWQPVGKGTEVIGEGHACHLLPRASQPPRAAFICHGIAKPQRQQPTLGGHKAWRRAGNILGLNGAFLRYLQFPPGIKFLQFLLRAIHVSKFSGLPSDPGVLQSLVDGQSLLGVQDDQFSNLQPVSGTQKKRHLSVPLHLPPRVMFLKLPRAFSPP